MSVALSLKEAVHEITTTNPMFELTTAMILGVE